MRLLPGEQLSPPDPPGKELVIAVTDVHLAAAAGGELKKRPGEIAWVQGRTSEWVNRGADPARFVVAELK